MYRGKDVAMGMGSSLLISLLLVLSVLLPMTTEGAGRDLPITLMGKVTAGAGIPIEGASVILVSEAGEFLNFTHTNTTGDFVVNVTQTLPSGSMIVIVHKEDHFERSFPFTATPGNNSLGTIELTPIPSETETVSGVVVYHTGGPVDGADISMEYSGSEGRYGYDDETTPDGEFSFTVFPGEFSIQVHIDGISVYEEDLVVKDGEGPYSLGLSVPMVPPKDVTIKGYVSDGADPLPGSMVAVRDLSMDIGNQTIADVDGYYEIDFWGGEHAIISILPEYDGHYDLLDIPSSGTFWYNITLEKEIYFINGTVTDKSAVPIEGITVQFLRPNSFIQFNTVSTGASGEFSIKVPPGQGYLAAMEESPFDTEEYDVFFYDVGVVSSDHDIDITLQPKGLDRGTMSIVFSDWTRFTTSSKMGLELNASKAARAMIDLMVGNGDMDVNQDEADRFTDLMMATEGDMAEGQFGESTVDNLTVEGNPFDLMSGSVTSEFLNLTGPINANKGMEFALSAVYSMNGSLPGGTTLIDLTFNGSYAEGNEEMIMLLPIPEKWMYIGHTPTLHNITIDDDVLRLMPAKDPDEGDEVDSEWATITFANDTFSAKISLHSPAKEGELSIINASLVDHVPENVITFSWEIDGVIFNTTTPYLEHIFLENGTYDSTVTVQDAYARSTMAFLQIEVTNKDPALDLKLVGGTNRTFFEGDALTFIINGSDVVDDPMHLQWGVLGLWGENLTYDGINTTFEVVIPDDGNFSVSARLMDDDGGLSMSEIIITALNKAPNASIEMKGLNDLDLLEQGVWLEMDVTVTDVDADTVEVEWVWPELASIETMVTGSDLRIRFLDPGDYQISVRISDEDGGEIIGNWTIQVIEDPDFDNDNDTMPRWWEKKYDLDDDDPSDASGDPDMDNLTNVQEYENGTDPNDPDTDGDGIPDDHEIDTGTDPTIDDADEDPDGDGLTNIEEYYRGSDPQDPFDPKKDSESDSPLFLILLIIGVILFIGAFILIMARRRQDSLEYEE